MKRKAAASPSDYVSGLRGWQRKLVESLRRAVRTEKRFAEKMMWGHIVYLLEGPAILIRAEDERVLFGLWRGQRLLDVEPRLKATGRYEMATAELLDRDLLVPSVARKLAKAAADLNIELGDPRNAAKRPTKRRRVASRSK